MTQRVRVPLGELEQYLQDHPEPAIVEFWRLGCSYCTRLDGVIRRASPDLEVPVIQVLVDWRHPVLEKFEIESTPTCLIVANGEELSRLLGLMTPRQMIQWTQKILALTGHAIS